MTIFIQIKLELWRNSLESNLRQWRREVNQVDLLVRVQAVAPPTHLLFPMMRNQSGISQSARSSICLIRDQSASSPPLEYRSRLLMYQTTQSTTLSEFTAVLLFSKILVPQVCILLFHIAISHSKSNYWISYAALSHQLPYYFRYLSPHVEEEGNS